MNIIKNFLLIIKSIPSLLIVIVKNWLGFYDQATINKYNKRLDSLKN